MYCSYHVPGNELVYKCSICPGERIFTTPPLGHDWGPWTCVNSRQHMRTCRRCGLTQYENHSMSSWHSHGDGNYSRNCPICGYSQSKGLFLSVSTTDWTAGNVTVNVSGYDEGEGNSSITLYRVNCITGATTTVGSYGHGGAHGWTNDSFIQTDEGIYYFYAISTDTQGHSIQTNTGRVVKIENTVCFVIRAIVFRRYCCKCKYFRDFDRPCFDL